MTHNLKHIRAGSFLLLLLALTGYLLEPSIDWDGIRVDPRTTYMVLTSLLFALGLFGIMWREK